MGNKYSPTRITYNGVTRTSSEWAEIYDLSAPSILYRHRKGIPFEAPKQIKRNNPNSYKPPVEFEDVHWDNIEDCIIKQIAVATVLQAVDDWRYLCKTGNETLDCNFKELKRFFKYEMAEYLGDEDLAKRIWHELKKERIQAKRGAGV